MNQAFKKALSLALLVGATAVYADCPCPSTSNTVATCFVPRSQGRDKVIQMVGSTEHTHLYNMECWYGTFAITPEYTQSFRSKDICHCLFGPALTSVSSSNGSSSCNSCDDCTLRVQGCGVANRDSKALAAENFLLPTDFDSTINFKPRIRNVLVNFDLYVGLDEWLCGLYFRIYGPYVNSRWDLNFCETINAAGTLDPSYPEGVYTPGSLAPADLHKSFCDYVSGKTLPATTGDTTNVAAGDPSTLVATTFQPLKCAKIQKCDDSENGFADLRFELGWDFWSCPDYHIGLNIQAAAPTGKKKCEEFLFAPRIGNDAWEVGGGLNAHYTFWHSECEDMALALWLDANITHVFKHDETRCFDLKNKPLSRYLLAAKFKAPANDLGPNNLRGTTADTGTRAQFQFANEFAPVANLTRQEVEISNAVQVDLVAMLNFVWCGFSIDAGYNFWYRSCDKFSCGDCPPVGLDGKTWGLKGTAHMFGFAVTTSASAGLVATQAVPLSATQSSATLYGTNACLDNAINANVDNPQLAFAGTPVGQIALVTAPGGEIQINTSIQPVLLTKEDVDLGARTRGLSHKVFGHISYTFDCECWVPYLGVGGSAEFAQRESKCPTTTTTTSSSSSCSSCIDCALSQWAVWVKGGISFN